MLFSIIVPVYNAEKFLENTINSVVSQSFADWQLILVNDGSADTSLDICKRYADADKRIVVYTQENAGPSAARNTGISHAQGDYIMFLDSDDEYLPGALDNVAKKIIGTSADIIMSAAKVVNIETNETIHECDYMLSKNTYTIDELCLQIAEKRVGPSPWRYAVKRDIIKKNNLLFPEGIFLAEDCLWVNNMLGYAKTAVFNDAPYYKYNIHSNSITTTIKYSRLEDLMIVCDKLFLLAEQRNGIYRKMHLNYCCVLSNTLLQNYSQQSDEDRKKIKSWIKANNDNFSQALKTIPPMKAAAALLGNFNAMLLFALVVKLKLKFG